MPYLRHRHSIRLQGYDYSGPGGYFVTVCTHRRECFLGEVVQGNMRLSEFGIIVQNAWIDLPNHYRHVQLDAFIVMPNHVHGIVVLLDDDVGAGSEPAPTKRHSLSEIIRSFKTFSARRINTTRRTPGVAVWQRNYYEHIIRSEKDHRTIQEYILNNALQWEKDEENPQEQTT